MDICVYLEEKRQVVDRFLEKILPPANADPGTLHQAMRYSIFAGGKRLRPILVISSHSAVGGASPALLPVACAFELIHTYSLIHDDLPAMDNDDYRRGKPTSHRVFGEGIAILTGDALLTLAFSLLAHQDLDPAIGITIIREVATASGTFGMIGGQVADIQYEGKEITPSLLEQIHARKTGALIRGALRVGALLADADHKQLDALSRYGEDIGLAFQIADDILNVEGTEEEMGKGTQTDASRGKKTYPGLFGIEESKRLAHTLSQRAIAHLEGFGRSADPLRDLALYIVERKQ